LKFIKGVFLNYLETLDPHNYFSLSSLGIEPGVDCSVKSSLKAIT